MITKHTRQNTKVCAEGGPPSTPSRSKSKALKRIHAGYINKMEHYNLLSTSSVLRVSKALFILKIQTRINHVTEIDPQTTLQVTRHTWAKYGSSNPFQIYTTLKQESNSFLINGHPKTTPGNLCKHFERRWKLRKRPKRGSKPPNLLVQPVSLP